ncbi:unnamed protein product [Bursaphelenchus xylophilus]|uniref:(pine wood nematode) hypothetical protein n=1 Tax=Bursaphelenchus xylophilus TaxID=6326 RepID=A0A1I7SFP1_BURXY|nr:unnamed protein product [Bursaphelenchus xylophilus]CAG9131880.1 unnamed protein product [Bursaphelenchus xylophilus]
MTSLMDEITAAALTAYKRPDSVKENEIEDHSKNDDISPSSSTEKTKKIVAKKKPSLLQQLFASLKRFDPTPEQQKWREFNEKKRKFLARLPTLFQLKKAKMLSDRKKNLGF